MGGGREFCSTAVWPVTLLTHLDVTTELTQLLNMHANMNVNMHGQCGSLLWFGSGVDIFSCSAGVRELEAPQIQV